MKIRKMMFGVPSAVIFGISGTELTAEERKLFEYHQPWGFILFARNLENADQVRKLSADLKSCVAHNAHIFLDEEGGRVSRLRSLGGWIGPPAADFWKSGASVKQCTAAIRANYRAIGARLADLGFTADCAPVLDIPVSDADPIIGDRAFADNAMHVPILARACLDGLADAGIHGVIKHIPGHGRANVDSHKDLPVVHTARDVLSVTDFAPFRTLRGAEMAMTAHVVYADIDADNPATTSKIIIDEVIRDEIGFDGLLMSDDLDMQALTGTLAERGQAALDAGCDMLLHCSGDLDAMKELMETVPILDGKAIERANRAAPRTESCQMEVESAIKEAQACLAALGTGA